MWYWSRSVAVLFVYYCRTWLSLLARHCCQPTQPRPSCHGIKLLFQTMTFNPMSVVMHN